MSIVYQHTRNDHNTVFYVGVGLTNKRAYSNRSRNKHWHSIVKLAGYTVEIIHNNIDYEKAHEIEKELILKYGRRDLGTGCLVNLTDGGEGVSGSKWSEDQKNKISGPNNRLYGKKQSKDHILKKSGKNCVHYNKKGSDHPASRQVFTKERIVGMSRRMMGNSFARGIHRTDEEKERLRTLMTGNKRTLGLKFSQERKIKHAKSHFKSILQLNIDGLLIREWESIKEAGETLKINRGSISTCLKGKCNNAGRYNWKYK